MHVLIRNKKIMYIAVFLFHVKVGFKGVYISWACYPDVYRRRICALKQRFPF